MEFSSDCWILGGEVVDLVWGISQWRIRSQWSSLGADEEMRGCRRSESRGGQDPRIAPASEEWPEEVDSSRKFRAKEILKRPESHARSISKKEYHVNVT